MHDDACSAEEGGRSREEGAGRRDEREENGSKSTHVTERSEDKIGENCFLLQWTAPKAAV